MPYRFYTDNNSYIDTNDRDILNTLILHRTDGPAHIEYSENNIVVYECWYKDGITYRDNDYSVFRYTDSGYLESKLYIIDNKTRLLVDKPSVVNYYSDTDKISSEYYSYDNIYYHCLNGPACLYYNIDGTLKDAQWYVKGLICLKTLILANKDHILYAPFIIWNKEQFPQEYNSLLKKENIDLFD